MKSTPTRAAIGILRALLATTVLAAGLWGWAQGAATPAPLADGSEIVVTDGDGNRLLGYGRVEGAVLRLSLVAHDDAGLAVMVIDPDGRLSTLVGRFAPDGLRVRAPGAGEDVTLSSWLSERGVRLTLEPAERPSDDDDRDDRDDDRNDDRDDDRDDGDRDDGDEDDEDVEADDDADDAGDTDDDTDDEDDTDDDTDDDADDADDRDDDADDDD